MVGIILYLLHFDMHMPALTLSNARAMVKHVVSLHLPLEEFLGCIVMVRLDNRQPKNVVK